MHINFSGILLRFLSWEHQAILQAKKTSTGEHAWNWCHICSQAWGALAVYRQCNRCFLIFSNTLLNSHLTLLTKRQFIWKSFFLSWKKCTVKKMPVKKMCEMCGKTFYCNSNLNCHTKNNHGVCKQKEKDEMKKDVTCWNCKLWERNFTMR